MDQRTTPKARPRTRWRAGAWPLTLKFTLILLVAALLPTLLVAYSNLHGGREGVAQTERANLALAANRLAQQLDQLIDSQRAIARLVAEDQEIQAYLGMRGNPTPTLQSAIDYQMALIMHAIPDLANLFLMNTEGIIVASPHTELVGSVRPFREYFLRAMRGEEYSSNLLMGLSSGQSGVYFSAPVHDPDGFVLGVAVAKLRGSTIEGIMRDIDPEVTAFLVDADSVVIDHPDTQWRYRTLSALDATRIADIQARSHFPVATLEALPHSGLEAGLAFTQPSSIDFVTDQGEPWVSGVAPMRHHGWRVFLAEPESRFAAPLHALFRQSVVTLCAIGLLVMLMAWLLGRAMTRPILVLTGTALQLKTGNYDQALTRHDLIEVGARRDELGTLAQVFHAMAEDVHKREFLLDQKVQQRTQELADKNRLLAATYQRVDAELRLAHDMQQALLPRKLASDGTFQIHAGMRPAREMGGDFYDYIPLDSRRSVLLVADVSGKGVPAAFFMGVSSTILRDVASSRHSPAATLARANDLLCERNPMELFVTVFCAVYDAADSSLTYACAGHNPPLLRRADGRIEPLPVARDIALGVMPGMPYTEHRMQLCPGDLLLIYTDGITEALSVHKEEFGEARLSAWMARQSPALPPDVVCADLAHTLSEFVGDAEPSDDITQMALWVRPENAPLWGMTWHIPTRLESIAVLAGHIEQALESDPSLAPDARAQLAFQVNLCVDELATNIIRHGVQQDPDRTIQATLLRYAGHLEILLHDDAPPFDCFAQASQPDLSLDVTQRPIGGLGVHFVRTLMDAYSSEHDGTGNRIVLRKQLPQAPSAPAANEA